MKTWFTSDLHLGHWNIARYCGRPFKDLDHMDAALIRNWNARVKNEDTVYHLGDFCFKNSQGGKEGEGGMTKAYEYEKQLNGKIIHLKGNHDKNNGVCSILTTAIIETAGLEIMLTHVPPETTFAIPDFCDVVFCGHVHEKWKIKVLDYPQSREKFYLINVGVDVWGFMPVDINEIMAYWKGFKRNGTAYDKRSEVEVTHQNFEMLKQKEL
jgi:calcineurin-like phosphoesterase family protein